MWRPPPGNRRENKARAAESPVFFNWQPPWALEALTSCRWELGRRVAVSLFLLLALASCSSPLPRRPGPLLTYSLCAHPRGMSHTTSYGHTHMLCESWPIPITHTQPCPELFPHPNPVCTCFGVCTQNTPCSSTCGTMFPHVLMYTHTSMPGCTHVSSIQTLPYHCAHAHSPTLVSTQACIPRNPCFSVSVPTIPLPTSTHLPYTCQRMHTSSLCFPYPGSGPRGFGPGGQVI